MKTLLCNTCNRDLPESEFYDNPSNKARGKHYYCKQCSADLQRKRQQANPHKYTAQSRKRNYGLTQDQYDDMREDQDYCCAICGVDEDDLITLSKSRLNHILHVDHDHTTNKVRALLCFRCNHGLGKFQDSIEVLERALVYLRKYANEPDFD